MVVLKQEVVAKLKEAGFVCVALEGPVLAQPAEWGKELYSPLVQFQKVGGHDVLLASWCEESNSSLRTDISTSL